jgi:hypothetical protein
MTFWQQVVYMWNHPNDPMHQMAGGVLLIAILWGLKILQDIQEGIQEGRRNRLRARREGDLLCLQKELQAMK